MFNDIESTKNGHYSECILRSREASDHAKKNQRWHRSFLGLGDERNMGWNVQFQARKGNGDQQANQMIELFAQSGHPMFWGTSALIRGTLEAKIRKKHYSHDSGLRKHWVNDAHCSLSKSAQCPRSSVELVKRFGWQDARSEICWSEYVHFRINMNSYHNSWIRKKFVLW